MEKMEIKSTDEAWEDNDDLDDDSVLLDTQLRQQQQQQQQQIDDPKLLITDDDGNSSYISDRLAEKLLRRISFPEDQLSNSGNKGPHRKYMARPSFSIQLMSSNFRRFSTRIGAIFFLQRKIKKLITWNSYSQTISLLSVYTFVCLKPHLISILPLVFILILFTSFYSTHYPLTTTPAHLSENLISDEPVKCTPGVKPIRERSLKFFRNMRDIQNIMDDYSKFHDQIINSLTPLFDFSNEGVSCNLFIFVFFTFIFFLLFSHIIPWRLILLLLGWSVICANHPLIKQKLLTVSEYFLIYERNQIDDFLKKYTVINNILSPSEVREVEIFEIQLLSSAGEWESFIYGRSPFTSSFGVATGLRRPKGTRYLEGVHPPKGWEWIDNKWTLDLNSLEWVEERIITGVEVEIDGERWVYDVRYQNDEIDMSDQKRKQILSSTQEKRIDNLENREKIRGHWRRRRWVRTVKQRWSKVED